MLPTKSKHPEYIYLVNKLLKHDNHEENSTISDSEYDDLFNEIIEIEKKYPSLIVSESPTQRFK